MAFSAMTATISAPKPATRGASWTTTTRPVFATEARIASSSSGFSDRMSTTSALASSSSAASRQVCTIAPYAISVTSVPSRAIRARPSGTTCSPSGTSPRGLR